jgi:hypothetical protein
MGIIQYPPNSIPLEAIYDPNNKLKSRTGGQIISSGINTANPLIVSIISNEDISENRFISFFSGKIIKANQSNPVDGFIIDSVSQGNYANVYLPNQIINCNNDLFSAANKNIFLIDPTDSTSPNYSEAPNYISNKYFSLIGKSLATNKFYFCRYYCYYIS